MLCGLPTLCANGLFSGLGRHLALPKGYYSALHILCVLGFMALARIHRMASPAHDRAIALLPADLTATEFRHPETGLRFIYQLV